MTGVETIVEPRQSAAAPSPFPPIADYAFLSNCHTGALVAPDGAVDWLCVPSFDAPPPVHAYAPGSWGPEAANKLVAGHGRWHGPWVTE